MENLKKTIYSGIDGEIIMLINGVYVHAVKYDEYSYEIKTSDNRTYMAVEDFYCHYHLYESNNLDDVYNGKAKMVKYSFGYDVNMCMSLVPTIEIKLPSDEYKLMNFHQARNFLERMERCLSCSKEKKLEVMQAHTKNARVVKNVGISLYDFRIVENIKPIKRRDRRLKKNIIYGYYEEIKERKI